jgi:hypothetical protein
MFDYCDLVSVKSGYHQFWQGYILGQRNMSIFSQSLVRFFEKDKWDIQWCFDFDLTKIGRYDKPEVSLKPENLVLLQNNGWPVGVKQPPIIVIPPVEPPPVVIPPEPPPVVTPKYEIVEFERKENKTTPVLVGSWVRNGDNGILTSPSNNVIKFTTGSKGEYGIGGYEAGYIREEGQYQVKISDSVFSFTTEGKQFIKLAWREVQKTEQQVKLRSVVMSKTKAQQILDLLEKSAYSQGVFSIEGI